MSLHYQMASGFREKIDKEICDPQYFHRVEWQTSSTGLYRGNPYTYTLQIKNQILIDPLSYCSVQNWSIYRSQ